MVYDFLQKSTFTPFASFFKYVLNPLWTLYCWISGMLVIATVFALILHEYGNTSNPAVVIQGPAQNDNFEYREGYKNLPTLKVPLNGKITFQLPWYVNEGGCERLMTRSFQKGISDLDSYILTKQTLEKPYPVGRPGLEPVELSLPTGITPGIWLYHSVGTVRNCPVPRKAESTTYSKFYIEVYDPDGPVSIEIGSPQVLSPKVKLGGKLQYKESFRRTEEINSEVLFTFTEIGGKSVVLERRPVVFTKSGEFLGIVISSLLPQGVHVGKWRVSKTVISTRPGGKTRVDPMFEFDFEVVP